MEITVLPRAILAQAIQSQLTISFLVSVNLDAENVLPEFLNFLIIMERSDTVVPTRRRQTVSA